MLAFSAAMNPNAVTGSRLPERKRPRLFQDLLLLLKPGVLAPQPPQLFALVAAQAVVALAAIDLNLLDPVPQRLAADAELAGDVGHRAVTRPIQRTASRLNSSEYGARHPARRRSLDCSSAIAWILSAAPDGASDQVSTKPGALQPRIDPGSAHQSWVAVHSIRSSRSRDCVVGADTPSAPHHERAEMWKLSRRAARPLDRHA